MRETEKVQRNKVEMDEVDFLRSTNSSRMSFKKDDEFTTGTHFFQDKTVRRSDRASATGS